MSHIDMLMAFNSSMECTS